MVAMERGLWSSEKPPLCSKLISVLKTSHIWFNTHSFNVIDLFERYERFQFQFNLLVGGEDEDEERERRERPPISYATEQHHPLEFDHIHASNVMEVELLEEEAARNI